MIHKKLLFFCLLSLLCYCTNAQQAIRLSDKAAISVLTCGPGDELYTRFGHSAFRVKDPEFPFDIVYNYGTFDFGTAGFYTKFARGKLLYQLSRSRFERFLAVYNYEQRWVKEQQLELSQQQKQAIFDFLEKNALPENKDYKYDFFFENCATKKWDVMQAVDRERFSLNGAYTDPKTFREALQGYLHYNSWGSFGIDLALGAVTDRQATPKQLMYLPEYVFKAFDSAKNGDKDLVKGYTVLLQKPKRDHKGTFFSSPLFVSLSLLAAILFFTLKDLERQKRTRSVDFLLFATTGIAGVIICFLWFFTDHTATHKNFNILWAFAPNIAVAAIVLRTELPRWFSTYLKVLVLFLFVLLVLWVAKIQVFAPILIVMIIALLLRYLYLLRLSSPKK